MAGDELHSFGIDATTHKPLAVPDDAVFEQLLDPARADATEPPVVKLGLAGKEERAAEVSFGALPGELGSVANELDKVGWGILFGPGVDQTIKDALQPLIEHRQQQGADPFRLYDQDGYRPGENAWQWLKRQGVSLNQVDPAGGVPYYLLIVASPQDISFEFQYVLDLEWACGRLWFETADEFRRYAESVVAYETAPKPAGSRQIAMFAPLHDFDGATQLFNKQVAEPFQTSSANGRVKPLGAEAKFRLNSFTAEKADKDRLRAIFRGHVDGGTPAILFSGGHGMQFANGDPLQRDTQGALVCSDWKGGGPIGADHWFAAKDVPDDAKLHGLVHFMFACHGGGVPQFDNFDRLNNQPKEIAPQPFFSRLPQALLAHRNGGALAVVAHVERAWAYSFQGDGSIPQTQGFRSVLAQVLSGNRIGQATDAFNTNWAKVGVRLTEAQDARARDSNLPVAPIKRLWIQRDDARNFMVFGDPAVKLRVTELQ